MHKFAEFCTQIIGLHSQLHDPHCKRYVAYVQQWFVNTFATLQFSVQWLWLHILLVQPCNRIPAKGFVIIIHFPLCVIFLKLKHMHSSSSVNTAPSFEQSSHTIRGSAVMIKSLSEAPPHLLMVSKSPFLLGHLWLWRAMKPKGWACRHYVLNIHCTSYPLNSCWMKQKGM